MIVSAWGAGVGGGHQRTIEQEGVSCFISLPLLIPSVSSVKLWLNACGQLVGDLGLCCATQPIRREGSAAELEKRWREGGSERRWNSTN